MSPEYINKALALYVVADQAWARASIAQTDPVDRRASRCQQALQDHLSIEGWHWERFETAIHDALKAV